MTQDMNNNTMTRSNRGNKVFPALKQLRTLLLFLMMTVGAVGDWGQILR